MININSYCKTLFPFTFLPRVSVTLCLRLEKEDFVRKVSKAAYIHTFMCPQDDMRSCCPDCCCYTVGQRKARWILLPCVFPFITIFPFRDASSSDKFPTR